MMTTALLSFAALLEVGGDALIRLGLRDGRATGLLLGGAALVAYGLMVNALRWDFGRLDLSRAAALKNRKIRGVEFYRWTRYSVTVPAASSIS